MLLDGQSKPPKRARARNLARQRPGIDDLDPPPEPADDDASYEQSTDEIAIPQEEGWLVKGAKFDIMSPVPPQGLQEDFWLWMSNFPTEAWVYLISYLWRTDPMIDSKFGGRASNIKKITAAFTIDDIKQWEGSGGYRLDVVAMDQKTRKQARIGVHYFEIMDPDYPPRLPAGLWLEIPENKAKWGWVADALRKRDEAATMNTSRGPQHDNLNVAAIIRETREAVRQGQPPPGQSNGTTDQVMGLLLKQLDPDNQAKLYERLRGSGGEQKSEVLALTHLLIKQQEDRNERLERELADLRTELRAARQAPSPRTLVEQMKEQVELKALARQLAGKDVPEDPWSKAIESALTALPTALALWQGQPAAQTAATTTINTTATVAPASGAATPAGAPIVQEPPPQEPPTQGGPTPAMTAIVAKYGVQLMKHQSLLGDIVPIMKDHFKFKVGEGSGLTPGQAFSSWFLARFGDEKRKELIADLPITTIADLIEQTPNLASAMNPKEEVLKFLNDFNSYEEPAAA